MNIEKLKCGVCGRKYSNKSGLLRHFRLMHKKDVSTKHVEAILSFNKEVLNCVQDIVPMQIAGKKSSFVGAWGQCDICGAETCRRWVFKDKVHGDIFTCTNCRELKGRKKSTKKTDALDSWARLPGSYGSKKC